MARRMVDQQTQLAGFEQYWMIIKLGRKQNLFGQLFISIYLDNHV